MSMLSRRKGKTGELELRHLLEEQLGPGITRNLQQTRDGGHDIEGVGRFAVEVKRTKTATDALVRSWWTQCERQAAAVQRIPALAYRADRQDWRVLIPMSCLDIRYAQWSGLDWTAALSVPAFCTVVREQLHRTSGRAA